jgi:hypothetical protein
MSKPRNRSAQRKKKSLPAPVLSQTDLERCHRRWFTLWLGVMDLLKDNDPKAYARVLLKLRRHRLLSAAVVEPDENGYMRETDFPQGGFGGFTSMIPSDVIIQRAAAFAGDSTAVPLRGRARARPPALPMLMSYALARAAAEKQSPRVRLHGESAANQAYQHVAKEFGYEVETCRKEIGRGLRQLAQLLGATQRGPTPT